MNGVLDDDINSVVTPYGTIFYAPDRWWFAGSEAELLAAKAWARIRNLLP